MDVIAANNTVPAIATLLAGDSDLVPVLYHGTCPDAARSICNNGWSPKSGQQGGNKGQTRYLYLSTGIEDAEWFANEKGCDTVIAVRNIPKSYLQVDPEDGCSDTLDEELNLPQSLGVPGKVILIQMLPAKHFDIIRQESPMIHPPA